jgi:hypothetical protein
LGFRHEFFKREPPGVQALSATPIGRTPAKHGEAMKRADPQSYPDVSDILARKEEGRRQAAQRSFGEKIAIVEELRERLAPLKRAREKRSSLPKK